MATQPKNTKYHNIMKLKPTQYAVGILEVESKIEELKKLKKSKRRKVTKSDPIPVIISPDGEVYLVDHHHLVLALSTLGIKRVKVNILHDLSERKFTFSQFWRWMKKRNYYYPFCQFGEGPRNPLYLPNSILGLADDPYRSLAWFCRKEGAYLKTDEDFSEFHWANFFREKKLLDLHGRKGIRVALKKAVRLAQSKGAKKLPGYIPPGQGKK